MVLENWLLSRANMHTDKRPDTRKFRCTFNLACFLSLCRVCYFFLLLLLFRHSSLLSASLYAFWPRSFITFFSPLSVFFRNFRCVFPLSVSHPHITSGSRSCICSCLSNAILLLFFFNLFPLQPSRPSPHSLDGD